MTAYRKAAQSPEEGLDSNIEGPCSDTGRGYIRCLANIRILKILVGKRSRRVQSGQARIYLIMMSREGLQF